MKKLGTREVEDLTLRVYRARLDAAYPGDADRQVEKDGDGGERQRGRSIVFRQVVVETLVQLGLYEKFDRVEAAKRVKDGAP